jgi:hypothetical protein
MSSQRVFSSLVIRWVAVPSLATFLAAIPAMAQGGNGDYIFLVGTGFLCDLGDSSACPAVVKSAQGDSYELSGAGTLSTQSKSVTAAGTFTRKSRDGNALETGVWLASELVSFDSYGIAPGALAREGMAFGPPGFGPRHLPMLSGPMPAGGLAVFRISLLPMRGAAKSALLQVNCALGKVPDEHQVEGIRLAFEGGGEFDQELGGRTLFVLTRPAASGAAKARAPRVEPNRTPPHE